MPQQVFGADAVVSMVNRALANTSPSHSVYVNQVATAGATAAPVAGELIRRVAPLLGLRPLTESELPKVERPLPDRLKLVSN